MKNVLFAGLTAVFVLSCLDSNDPTEKQVECMYENIETDLPWLQQQIEDNDYDVESDELDVLIYISGYQNETVIITAFCCPSCNTTPPTVHSCSGVYLGYLGAEIDAGIMESATLIWSSENGVCPG